MEKVLNNYLKWQIVGTINIITYTFLNQIPKNIRTC